VGCIQVLVDHGASIDLDNKDGHTALTTAAGAGQLEALVKLVKHGGGVDHESRSGGAVRLQHAVEVPGFNPWKCAWF
jgi:ankyrin repeat protein